MFSRTCFAAVLLLALLPAAAMAQIDRGSVTGVTMDATRAVVPDVEITARNEATGINTNTVSTADGNYTLPGLPIGLYKVFRSSGLRVQVSTTTRLDIVLEVGSISETVTVEASNPLLQTDSAEVGATINTERFLELPLSLGGDIRNASEFIICGSCPVCCSRFYLGLLACCSTLSFAGRCDTNS